MAKQEHRRFVSLQVKLVMWAGLCLLVTGLVIIAYASWAARNEALMLGNATIEGSARTQASRLDAELEVAMDTARALALSLAAQHSAQNPANLNRDQVNSMLKNVLENNPNFLGVYTAWEPDAFDGQDKLYANLPGNDQTGRLIPYWVRSGGKVVMEPLLDYETEGAGEYYLCSKRSGKECIIDPYIYPIEGKDVLLASLIAPILIDGKFAGIAGVDLSVGFLQEMADQFDLFEKQGKMTIVSHNGTIAGETGAKDHVGKLTSDFHQDYQEDLKLIQAGEERFSQMDNVLEFFTPIAVGNSVTPWSVLVTVPASVVSSAATRQMFVMIGVSIVVVLLGLLALWFVVRRTVVFPITRLRQGALLLAEGDANLNGMNSLDITQIGSRNDEMGEIGQAFIDLIGYFRQMSETASSISRGDLTGQAQTRSANDLLGHAFTDMSQNLRESVSRVRENALTLKSASEDLAQSASQAGRATNQIAATIQQVARGLSQESESLSHTNSSVEQMGRVIDGVARGAQEQAAAVGKASTVASQITGSVGQVAGNAQAVSQEAANAAGAARKGSQTVEETIAGMQQIKAKVGVSAQKVQEMGQRSDQIGAIVETIEDIASQTNLLALNAAIEAARAGEHGKGFAVVADEVRKLAERAGGATKEIGGLIKGIQKTVNEAVSAMEDGAREVELGVARANQAGAALTDILRAAEAVRQQAEQAASATQVMGRAADELVSSVDSVSAVVEENTASTEEMAASSGEVIRAIENIASVSEENSAAVEQVSAGAEEMSAQVEEVTAAAQSLSEMARELEDIVQFFKLS